MIIRIKHKRDFTVIQNALIRNTNLSWKARGLLVFLLSHNDEYQIRIETLTTASEHDGTGSIISAIRELQTYGYMFFQKRQNPTTKQWLPGEWIVSETPECKNPKSGFSCVRVSLTQENHSLYISKDIYKKTKRKKIEQKGIPSASFSANDLPERLQKILTIRKAWSEFVEHRKQKKCPITPLAWQKIIKQMLNQEPSEIVAAINKSITHGWRGLFFPESNTSSNSKQTIKLPLSKDTQTILDLLIDLFGEGQSVIKAESIVKDMRNFYSSAKPNPRDKTKGVISRISWQRFFNGYISFLRDKQRSWPATTPTHICTGGARWREYVSNVERTVQYSFRTGEYLG